MIKFSHGSCYACKHARAERSGVWCSKEKKLKTIIPTKCKKGVINFNILKPFLEV